MDLNVRTFNIFGITQYVAFCVWCFSFSIFQSSSMLSHTSVLYVLSHFSRLWLFMTLWTGAYQAPLSIEFSRQEYLSGLLWPTPLYCCSWIKIFHYMVYHSLFIHSSVVGYFVCFHFLNIMNTVHFCVQVWVWMCFVFVFVFHYEVYCG